MALIRKTKLKAKSAYETIVSNKQIADLLTKAHSTKIRAGNELEDLIAKHTKHNVHPLSNGKKSVYYEDLALPKSGKTLVPKLTVKGFPGVENTNLDIAVLDADEKVIYTVEMKDGDNFDTKKSNAERKKLEALSGWLANNHSGWTVKPKIVLWSCQDIKDASFKDKLAQQYLLTGKNAQKLLGVVLDEVEKDRSSDRVENEKSILLEMQQIVENAKQGGTI